MIEKLVERTLYASRWILAPVYIGLSLAMLALMLKFFQEGIHLLLHVFDSTESDFVLVILTMIDLALVGGLIVMVMISGYENFVSKIDIAEEAERLNWLGKMDSTSLKSKVAASIVAISSIHLLQVFMNVERMENEKIMWSTFLHLTFVASAMGMAYQDKLTGKH